MRLVALVGVTLLAGSAPAQPQQAGHATVPQTGAAARSSLPTAERQVDTVLARIEELRKALAETARRYKKAKPADRAATEGELLAALARVDAEVAGVRAAVERTR